MRRVKLHHKLAGGVDNQVRNILSALKRKLPEFEPEKNGEEILRRLRVPVAICGSGPTIEENLEELRNFKGMIVAINAAHDYLIDHGIKPHMFVAVDPRVRIVKGFRKPIDDCVYMIASQCHPGIFNHLNGRRVVIWHSQCNAIAEISKQVNRKMGQVHGGTTASLRAIAILYLMGFRMIHLYGVDSSFRADLRNIDGVKPEKTVEAEVCGKRYLTDNQMMSQAMEMTQVLNLLPGIRVTSHGDSLMTATLQEAAKYRSDCYDTEDLHRVRPKTAVSVHGGGPFIDETLSVPGVGDAIDDWTATDDSYRLNGVHIQPVSRAVPLPV